MSGVRGLQNFFLGNYLLAVLFVSIFASDVAIVDLRTAVFISLVVMTYAGIYLLPAWLLTWFAVKLARLLSLEQRPVLIFTVASGGCAMTLLLLAADHKLYQLYGFHINAFVVNLVVTPGGIDSLDAGVAAQVTLVGALLLLLAFEFLVGFLSIKLAQRQLNRTFSPGKLVMLLVVFSIAERMTYAVSDVQSHSGVIQASQYFPFYSRLKIRSLAAKLGYADEHKERGVRLAATAVSLRYPLRPIRQVIPKHPLNVVWLVAESLRWDMLTPEIMPNTWALAQQSWHLTDHYSGGNGTRQGLFALFYGLYGSYWNSFLLAERGPVLFDVLRAQKYQLQFYTSAAFTYPEFDQTLFAQIAPAKLHQFDNSVAPVDRDRGNIDNILRFIEQRDRDRPFMTFLFFESTHARYSFPPAAVLRQPYLKNLNYAIMSRESLQSKIGELKNRYINASHYVDSQIARLVVYLRQNGLMDSTLIMITGDHGEEFMERGHWGHNRGFSKEQLKTPMVLWIPGRGHREISRMTSHMDMVPTLLPLLGVENPQRDYSLGADLLKGEREPYVVASDIAGLAYIDNDYTFSVPFRSSLTNRNQLWHNGRLQRDAGPFLRQHGKDLKQILLNARKFTKTAIGD